MISALLKDDGGPARSAGAGGLPTDGAAGSEPDRRVWWKRLSASPWPWLGYLPIYASAWLYRSPTTFEVVASTFGLIVFLCVYFWGWYQKGAKLVMASVAVVLIAFGLASAGGNWTVVVVYASALAGMLRPSRQAARLVAGIALATAAYTYVFGTLWPWGMFAVFMIGMIGAANISNAALQDKTAALTAAHEEVQRLAATAERERIGRDLHDLLGRTLTLVTIKAELAARLIARDAERAEAEMREVAQASREALAEVRAAISGMTGTGLAREIEQSCLALQAADIACTIEGSPEAIDHGASAVLAMALREAVTNVIRHSGASRCRIDLSIADRTARLVVEDDGDGTAVREAGGITGMRARLAAAGGSFSVEGGKTGTRLLATLPVGG